MVVPVSLNEMLLRGCTLKNSGHVLGLVVYTGPDSRIQMNAAAPPRKTGQGLCVQASCASSPPAMAMTEASFLHAVALLLVTLLCICHRMAFLR